jgi:preprotein translocase subunit SecF
VIQVFHNANFRLMWRTKYLFMGFSTVAMAVAVGAIAIQGFNLGIDFAGGTAVQIRFREAPRVEDLRRQLEEARLGDINIQRIGAPEDNEVLIRVEQQRVKGVEQGGEGGQISSEIVDVLRLPEREAGGPRDRLDLNLASESAIRSWIEARLADVGFGREDPTADAATAAALVVRHRTESGGLFRELFEIDAVPGLDPAIATLFREQATLGPFVLRGVEFVGPTAGRELVNKTGWAIFLSVLGILGFVWFRFHKAAWGVAAIVALVHDVTISAGAMALSGKEFSLPVVAALLTILGYSINDTIVIFDRIRENLRLYREYDFEEVVNASINQTLSRSVLTSFTLFVAVTALFLYGGDKLNPLSFCLMVGVIFGSYSSIFVAAALLTVAYRYLGARHVKA